jgi:anti-anti-sigma regulatory factor
MKTVPRSLHMVRIPGPHGPIIRCSGELSVATAEALRRELALLEPLGHRVLTVSLAGCGLLDWEGVVTLLQSFQRLRDQGRALVLVVPGIGEPEGRQPARLLQADGLDRMIPTFPDEETATLALRGAGPAPPAPTTWEAARAAALARWRVIQHLSEQSQVHSVEEALHLLTSMTALCERAEELFQELPAPGAVRCQFCPLYYALGGRPKDIGCRSRLEPIIEALRADDLASARAQVAEVIRAIETMPLPVDDRVGDEEQDDGPTLPSTARLPLEARI